MNISTDFTKDEKKVTIIKGSLSNIKAYNEDFGVMFHLRRLCMDLNWRPWFNGIITENDYREFQKAEEYALKAFAEEQVSSYQKNSIINITNTLYEAKLLRDARVLCEEEFTSIFMTVRLKIFQKFSSLEKSYLKNLGITKNSLSKLRAKVSTLQSEN